MNTNFNKTSEFIRLTHNAPLTLTCSALADFLWEDFIRETRSSVSYISSTHNITQISRFGKELFERLYQGDSVTWLVSLEDYEDYFRAKQDGNPTAVLKNYKPENAFWYLVMSALSSASAWTQLLQNSVGNQFNAGNNAVRILNDLADFVKELIEDNQIDADTMLKAGEKLEDLREKFKQAKANGDDKGAEAARAEGKALAQAIQNQLELLKASVEAEVNNAVDDALRTSKNENDALETLWGTTDGEGFHTQDLQTKKELAAKLQKNNTLKQVAKQLGFLKRVWTERKRAKRSRANYEAINGACFSNDITKAFPLELALAGTEKGRALFALKHMHKTILTKDYEAHRKDLGRGPIILYVDTSGSMSGSFDIWAKAITMTIAAHAGKDSRDVHVHLFDNRVGESCILKHKNTNLALIDFISSWRLGGGTSFNAVLLHALSAIKDFKNADVLMITDGFSSLDAHLVTKLNKHKETEGIQWTTLCLGSSPVQILHDFSDFVYSVDISNPDETIDTIQKSIRV